MSALVMYRVGGREYPLTRSARCHTCRSPHRRTVEVALVGGASCSEAVQDLPDDAGLTSRNVREHLKRGHLPVEEEVVARLVEQEAQRRARQIEDGVAVRTQALTMATTVVELATARLLAGELEPTISEGIRMAKLLIHYDQTVRQEQCKRLTEQLRRSGEAMTALLILAKALMPAAAWHDLVVAMEAHDRLRPHVPPPR